MENGPFIGDLPIKDGGFSIAMLVYQRGIVKGLICFDYLIMV